MLLLRVMGNVAGVLALAVCLGACAPDDKHGDEQKDPHFQRGIALVNSQDYKGAVEEFEKALETNPQSSAAHFELGCLYDKLNDYAAAIYHYEQHLNCLRDSDDAQLVKDRIRGCKQELANSEFAPPAARNLQREVDRLTAENLALKDQLAAWQHAPAANHSEARKPAPLSDAPAASSHPRLHVVKQRETISSIAVEYGVKASAVLAANPRVDPRRLRVGQSLALP
ncbi:MAG TPA: tetratricopeptide repeat protein [Verrucomicrobiae bacterium]|jgi:tetratricopeptide (TPR) repeat protein